MQLSILLYDKNILYYVDKETGRYFKRHYEQNDFPNPLSYSSFKIQAVLAPVTLLLNKMYRQLENPILDGILLAFSLFFVWLFQRSFQTFYSNLVQEFENKTNQLPIEEIELTIGEKRELCHLLVKSVRFIQWFNRLLIVIVLSCLYLFVRHHHIFALMTMVFFSCCTILLSVVTDFKQKINQIRLLKGEVYE